MRILAFSLLLLSASFAAAATAATVDELNELSKAQWGQSSDRALSYAEDALKLAREQSYPAGEATALRYIGIAYWYKDDYRKALDYGLQALKIFERIHDEKGMAGCRNTIGTIYLNLERYDDALLHYAEALKLAEKTGDKNRIAVIESNIGTCYIGKEQYPKALEHLENAYAILEAGGPSIDLASCLGSIAGAYRRLEQYDQALNYENRMLKVATQINAKMRIVDALTDIGEIYEKTGKYEAGLESINHAIEIARKEDLKSKVADAEKRLVDLYETQGKYKDALDAQKRYAETRDKVFTEESSKAIADMQVKYETEKKDREIRIQKLQLDRQRDARNALIGISFLVLVLALVNHGRYRAKKRAAELFEKLSRTDPMTGLSNRRAVLESLERERLRWQRQKTPFSVILADVDHFKQFNDRYGHDVGDQVLKEVAAAIRASIRDVDEAARWGGEEFLVLLPECPIDKSIDIAKRIQQSIRAITIQHNGSTLSITATFGVSAFTAASSIDDLVKRADLALYEGKEQGRDRIVASGNAAFST